MLFAAQAVQAAQVVMEDYAMSNVGMAPLQVRLVPTTCSLPAGQSFHYELSSHMLTGGRFAGCRL
jgi:hypothetical protein